MTVKLRDLRGAGLVGGIAGVLIAVIAPWLSLWPIPVICVVFVLLGVEAWALWRLRRAAWWDDK